MNQHSYNSYNHQRDDYFFRASSKPYFLKFYNTLIHYAALVL